MSTVFVLLAGLFSAPASGAIISQSGHFRERTPSDFYTLCCTSPDKPTVEDVLFEAPASGLYRVNWGGGSYGDTSISMLLQSASEASDFYAPPTAGAWSRSALVEMDGQLAVLIRTTATPVPGVRQPSTVGVNRIWWEPALAGDFNFDGAVDAADYTVWRDEGRSVEEYGVWKQNFGLTSSQQFTPSTVPEPSTLTIIFAASAGHFARLLLKLGQPQAGRLLK